MQLVWLCIVIGGIDKMDDHKHIINTIITRSKLLEMVLVVNGKDTADKDYDDIVKWFKETYEVKRIKK